MRDRDLQQLCAELGVTYLTGPANVHAKAGNLNSGLERSSGDLIAVFDADHASEQSRKPFAGRACPDRT